MSKDRCPNIDNGKCIGDMACNDMCRQGVYKPELKCSGKPKVAFICVHNSCRSQMAEALGKKFASDVFESYSAGTVLKGAVGK